MHRLLLGTAVAVLTLTFIGSARAGDHSYKYAGRGGYGYRTEAAYAGPDYSGYRTPYGYGHSHGHHSSRWGHFDYVPGHVHRHGNHSHYVPPHWDYHHRGHRHEVVPGPFPGTWSTTPRRHYRD